jgi:hypothetical protein
VHSQVDHLLSLLSPSHLSSGPLYIALKKAWILKVTARYKGKYGLDLKVSLQTHLATTTSIDLCGLGKSHGYAIIAMTIDMLPDDVLLDIFDFHRISEPDYRPCQWKWGILVHVCRRWRQVIFASPLRLHIQLHCTDGTPVRKHLGCWPAFPIVIDYGPFEGLSPNDEDNVLAALEHPNRVCLLNLCLSAEQLAKLVTVTREPFPVLTKLRLSLDDWDEWPVLGLPSGFLGGFVPCLQELRLNAIPFQELPTFLLSARDLVALHLACIPPTGYIPPEAMVACLATLPRLRSLYISLQISTSLRHRIDAALVTDAAPVPRTVLPALTYIGSSDVCNYVEDLVARMDCPQFNSFNLTYRNPSIDFQVSQIFKLINRSEDPRLGLFRLVDVLLTPDNITLKVSHKPHYVFIWLIGNNWGVWHVVQVFSQFSAKLSNVRHLSITSWGRLPELGRTDWVQLLYPFTTLQTLCVVGNCVGHVAFALEGVDKEMADEWLPALDLVYLESWPVSSVAEFCAVRRLCGRPVTFARTREEFDKRFESYHPSI